MTLFEEIFDLKIDLSYNQDRVISLLEENDSTETKKRRLKESFNYLKRKDHVFHEFYKEFYTSQDSYDKDTSMKLKGILLEFAKELNQFASILKDYWNKFEFGVIPYSKLEDEYKFRTELLKAEIPNALPMYKEREKPRDLFVIQAHSSETKKMCKIPKGIHLFHYCKSGCTLHGYFKEDKVSKEVQSLSRELACLGDIEIYDHFKDNAPYYSFEADHARHGIFKCETTRHGHQMIQIHDITEPMTILDVLLQIQSYRVSKNSVDMEFDLGMMSCRVMEGCRINNADIVDLKSNVYLSRTHSRTKNVVQMHIPPERRELFKEILDEIDRMTNVRPPVKPAVRRVVRHIVRPPVKPAVRHIVRPPVKPAVRHIVRPPVKPAVRHLVRPSVRHFSRSVKSPGSVKSTLYIKNKPDNSGNSNKQMNWDPFSNLDNKPGSKPGSKTGSKPANKPGSKTGSKPGNASGNKKSNSVKSTPISNPLTKTLRRTRSATIQSPNLTPSKLTPSKLVSSILKGSKRMSLKTMKNRVGSMFSSLRRSKVSN
jgi:hypothetical protein